MEYTAESYFVLTSGVTGWCVKHGDDTVCDIYKGGQAVAERIAHLLNTTPELT